jgi:hypothetical protein
MADRAKSKPSAQPGGPTLRENLELALRDETARHSFRIEMLVAGGLPAQSYRFEFLLAGTGEVQSQFTCRVSKREGKAGKSMLEPKQVLAILKAARRVLELPDEKPRFLPDTLVGFLEISDGTHTRRIYFAADAEQAKTQGKVPPAALKTVLDAIYTTAAKLMGERSVKP